MKYMIALFGTIVMVGLMLLTSPIRLPAQGVPISEVSMSLMSWMPDTLAAALPMPRVTPVPVAVETCQEFNAWLLANNLSQHVYGDINRPPAAGTTRMELVLDKIKPNPEVTTRSAPKVFCSCNMAYYDDATTCANSCHTSLACFTAICEPADVPEVCLRATVHAEFQLEQTMFRADWQPPQGPVTGQCRRHVTQWNRNVSTHERGHYTLGQAFVQNLQQQWGEGEEIFVCAESQEKAQQAFDAAVALYFQRADAAYATAVVELARQNRNYHAGHGSTVPQLDCSICQ